MFKSYGPWATSIDAGSNPQLSAFWRQRMAKLVPVSRVSATLSRLNGISLWITAVIVAVVPTFRSTGIAAEKDVPPVSTVHVVAEMRTYPQDNFSQISADTAFVKVEVWRDFQKPPKWRVEKPGRVVVMDGTSTLNFIRPNLAYKLPMVTEGAFDSGPLLELAGGPNMLDRLQQAAQGNGWDAKIATETTSAGDKDLVLTIEAKSSVPKGDYTWGKFFHDCETRRVYRFDEATKRLKSVEVYLHGSGPDVLILRTTEVAYNESLKSNSFSLELPKDVVWIKEVQKLPDNEKYAHMTPKETAKAFFEACAKEDWEEAAKFWGTTPITEPIKRYLGGLTLVSLGEPFQSAGYASPGKGWFVPYEIKLKMGVVKKFNLAVRNDNPAGRYVVDGGI